MEVKANYDDTTWCILKLKNANIKLKKRQDFDMCVEQTMEILHCPNKHTKIRNKLFSNIIEAFGTLLFPFTNSHSDIMWRNGGMEDNPTFKEMITEYLKQGTGKVFYNLTLRRLLGCKTKEITGSLERFGF
jgi:hypothetical protein